MGHDDKETVALNFVHRGKKAAQLTLYSCGENTLFEIGALEARQWLEEHVQLLEGRSYDFELVSYTAQRLYLHTSGEGNGIVHRHRAAHSIHELGQLTPGLNTGRLLLHVSTSPDIQHQTLSKVAVEVRSSKLTYREDYRTMLEYIVSQCSEDILMAVRSPAQIRLEPDPGRDPETIQQRFFFLKALLGSDAFHAALNHVLATPHESLMDAKEERSLRSLRKIGTSELSQLAGRTPRTTLPSSHHLYSRVRDLPRSIVSTDKRTTRDTPPNRFVKHALEVFSNFLQRMETRLRALQAGDSRLISEVEILRQGIEVALSNPLFKDVTELRMLPAGNTVLQCGSGYRQIYQGWLNFNAASRMVWKGGDDVYGAGKRDVAQLYEYWVYFRLLSLVCEVFELPPRCKRELIEQSSDGFGLRLKSGKHVSVQGRFKKYGRDLHVKLSYNRTFGRGPLTAGANDDMRTYPASGSWTKQMRPDYTLTIRPFYPEIEVDGSSADAEKKAEQDEFIAHIHFDAKYRVDDLKTLFGTQDDNAPVVEQRKGVKRADLLKMHTYRDAIRRSVGAYVIYPGTESINWLGYHEILPGLGAFPLRPHRNGDDGTHELHQFLSAAAEHVSNKATQRESDSYSRYRIFKEEPAAKLYGIVNEYSTAKSGTAQRATPPQDRNVICVWHKGIEQIEWIRRKGKIILRAEDRRGSVNLSPDIASSYYVLLHGEGGIAEPGLFEVATDSETGRPMGPRVFSADTLVEKYKYPLPLGGRYYLCFSVQVSSAFDGFRWAYRKLEGRLTGRESARPFVVRLSALLGVREE